MARATRWCPARTPSTSIDDSRTASSSSIPTPGTAGCSSSTRTSSSGLSSSYESSRPCLTSFGRHADRPPHVVRAAADPLASFHAPRTAGNHPPGRRVMKAFVVECYGTDGLRAADVPEPEVGDADVLVKVRAASINPLDKMVRNGEFKQLLKYRTPFVLGHDVAGVVTRVGSAVRDFRVGDEVYARPRDLRIGTFAEYIAIDQDDVAPKPASLTLHEAATVPLVSLAAWQALVDRAQVQPGQKVLVHAGAGGLGSTVIQLAKHLGATVATTARAANAGWVHSLGAAVVVDYTRVAFAEALSDYDVVLDWRGAENLEGPAGVPNPGEQAIGVAGPPDPEFAKQLGAPRLMGAVMGLLSRKVRKQARKLGVSYSFLWMQANGAQLRALATLYDAGHLRPLIDKTFPFNQTLEGLAYVEQGRANGKVVVTLD